MPDAAISRGASGGSWAVPARSEIRCMHPITSCRSREGPRLARPGTQREPVKGIPAVNGRGKSDRPIVPAKPSNKGRAAASRPAEEVEGRGLPMGNSGEPTRSRTQSRSDLPQAPDRVREAEVLRVMTQGRSPVR